MRLPGLEVKEAIQRLRSTAPNEFGLVVRWIEDSLHDQVLTNEGTQNPNVILHGAGRANSMRAIVLMLKE